MMPRFEAFGVCCPVHGGVVYSPTGILESHSHVLVASSGRQAIAHLKKSVKSAILISRFNDFMFLFCGRLLAARLG
jgi:hypothetical protein